MHTLNIIYFRPIVDVVKKGTGNISTHYCKIPSVDFAGGNVKRKTN